MFDEVSGSLDHAGDEDHVLGERHALERRIFVGVARIGKLDRQRADVRLVEGGEDFLQRDVVDVRAFPISITNVQPHAIARDAGNAFVDHGDMQIDRLDEIRIGSVAVEHGAVHGEIGCVDLQDEPGLMDRQILVAHLAGDGRQIRLVAVVVGVEHGRGDDARRGRGHEGFREWLAFLGDAHKARDLAVDCRGVVIAQLALCLRRVLLPAHVGKAARQILHQLREFLELASAAALGFAAEARHALRYVGLEADALLLAVVADVDAGVFLLGDPVTHCLFHLRLEQRLVVAFARLALDKKLAQRLVARQAADMGGEDAVAAQNHGGWLRQSFGFRRALS